MNFYKENLYNFQKIILNDLISRSSKLSFLMTYELILKWLRLFVKNNTKHQLILFEETDFFLNNLDLDLGQIDLICEIYRNNYELIKNVRDRHLKKFVSCIKNFGCHRKFLDLFEVIQVCRSEYILDNQAKTLDYLYLFPLNESLETLCHILSCIPRDNEGLVFSFEKTSTVLIDEDRIIKSELSNNLYGGEPVDFHVKLLNLMINSQNGTEGFNLNNPRIKKIFSFKYLLEILVSPDELFKSDVQINAKQKLKKVFSLFVEGNEDAGPNQKNSEQFKKDVTKLKPTVLDFYTKIYFKNTEKSFEKMNMFIEFIQNFIKQEKARLENFENRKNICHSEFVDYFFGKVLPFFNQYIKIIMKETLLSNEENDREDNEMLYVIAEILERNLENLMNILTTEQAANLNSFLVNYYEKSDELDRKIKKCVKLQNETKNVFLSARNDDFESERFDVDYDFISESTTSWKEFLKLVLQTDSLENVIIENFSFKNKKS